MEATHLYGVWSFTLFVRRKAVVVYAINRFNVHLEYVNFFVVISLHCHFPLILRLPLAVILLKSQQQPS